MRLDIKRENNDLGGRGSILVRAIYKKHKQLERVLTWVLGEGKLSISTIQWVIL